MWLTIVGRVRRAQRHFATRMILGEAPRGSRDVYLTRRGPSVSARMIEVPVDANLRSGLPVLPAVAEMKVI
jgi:hypothetical protein